MAELLSATGVCKRYGGVTVLSDVDLVLKAGEVHALIGENGAGKSTLIRVLTGDIQPDAGKVLVNGVEKSFSRPADARRQGIVAIFQELSVVPGLSVAENIVLGNEPGHGPGRQIVSSREAIRIAAKALSSLVGSEIDPRRPVSALSVAERQIVEIARALALNAPVIVMDEPTASLSAREADALLGNIQRMREAGKAVLFVSHRLNEVIAIADRITVLRGGRRVATSDNVGTKPEDLIALMVGRPLDTLYPPRSRNIGHPILEVSRLSRAGAFSDISFTLRQGEVLGFAGLVGAGRTEIMRALFGLDRQDSGSVAIDGSPVRFRGPSDAIRAGLAFVTESRKDDGLVLPLSGRENMVLAAPERARSGRIIRWGAIRAVTDRMREKLSIRGSIDAPAARLSGGNQQKLVLGRWVLANSRILILDEPTRGIDVGAKVEVYRLIHELAEAGAAILLVSSELPELLNVAHRIIVVSGGRITGEFGADAFDEQAILRAAFQSHLGHDLGAAA
jgi:ABC-type sugar transport system ATPase subunit